MSPGKIATMLVGLFMLVLLMLVPLSHNGSPSTIGSDDDGMNTPSYPGVLPLREPVQLHVNVSLMEAQFDQLQEDNREFMMKYPHIQVQLNNEPLEQEAYTNWLLQSQRREAADILLLDNGHVLPYAVSGFLQPVDRIVTADASQEQLGALLEPLRWNGYMWGVPKDADPYVMVWNKLLLKEMGLQTPPDDWASYESATAAIIERNDEVAVLNLSWDDFMQQLTWLARYDSSPEQLLSLAPYEKRQLDKLRSLQAMGEHIMNISLDAEGRKQLADAFLQSRLLVGIMPWSVYEALDSQVSELLIVDKESSDFPWLGGRSYVLTAGSAYGEEALQWISEMTGLQSQQAAYRSFGLLPVEAALYTSEPLDDEQMNDPPIWWGNELKELRRIKRLPAPDPNWITKWERAEQLWMMVGAQTISWEQYLAEAAAAG